MSLKNRLVKLEDDRANQQAKYWGDNPMLQYRAMLKDTTYPHKIKSIPQGISIDPEEAYQAMIGITQMHYEY